MGLRLRRGGGCHRGPGHVLSGHFHDPEASQNPQVHFPSAEASGKRPGADGTLWLGLPWGECGVQLGSRGGPSRQWAVSTGPEEEGACAQRECNGGAKARGPRWPWPRLF